MSFPQVITFELYIDGAWTDVTRIDDDTKVMGLDGTNAVNLTLGQDKFGASSRGADTLIFDYADKNAILNGENPLSPYHGKISQYTAARILIGGAVVGIGELATAIPRWDPAAQIVTVTITLNSIDRRLSQGKKPLNSAVFRDIMSPINDENRIAYWPMEEKENATQISSPMAGVPAMVITGTVLFNNFDSPGSDKLPMFTTGASVTAAVPSYTVTDETKIVTLWDFPEEVPLANGTVVMRWFTTGTISRFDLVYTTGGGLAIEAFNSGGAEVDQWGPVAYTVDDDHFLTSIELRQSGADVLIRGLRQIIDVNDPRGSTIVDDTFAGLTVGAVTRVTFAPNGDCDGLVIGHWAISNEIGALAALGDAIVGHAEEPAGDRMIRLFGEIGVAFSVIGDSSDTELMGPQPRQQFMDVIDDAIEVDGGLFYQKPDSLEFVYRTRVSLYNQDPALLVTYASPTAHFAPEFLPRFTDIARRNDVTFNRPKGSSARYIIPDDDPLHYTTQDPPIGMGVADVAEDRNVFADTELNDQAAWWAHLGSWKEKVISPIVIDLHRAVWTADAARTAAVRALRPGDMIEINTLGAPRWVDHSSIRCLVLGRTRSIGQFTDTFSFHTTPADAWEIDVTDSDSTLVTAIDDNDTSVRVAVSAGREWATGSPLDSAYYMHIGGDAMKVTTMATQTVTFLGANVATHANNTSVVPAFPAVSLADGDAMLIWAAIRNSGTGTVDLPSGWTSLANFGNARLIGRHYFTGLTAPTITFTGGAANATTSAQAAAFRGLSLNLDDGDYQSLIPSPQTQLNGSAQDIAYPALSVRRDGCVVLLCTWKQDDLSSSATPAAMDAEIGEESSTTGDDQGIPWYYDIQTTATDLAAGSVVITGGASAISRAVVVALRPLQLATVERDINDSATSHAIGDAVHAWRMGLNAL